MCKKQFECGFFMKSKPLLLCLSNKLYNNISLRNARESVEIHVFKFHA